MKIQFPPITGEFADGIRAYHKACLDAWEVGLSPIETAREVFVLAERWPFLVDEGHALRAMGDVWVNAQGHSLGDSIGRLASNEPVEAPPEQTSWEF